MYEDSWYNYIPELQQTQPTQQHKRVPSQSHGHRRRESLLQQPNGTLPVSGVTEELDELPEEDDEDSPPEPTLSRRAQSFSDYHDILRAELVQRDASSRKQQKSSKQTKNWEALALSGHEHVFAEDIDDYTLLETFDDELLDAGQQEYTIYGDQLAMTERHLETLIEDTNSALQLLASLSESFRGVEEQTTTFQSQCEDLLSEQTRLEKLADEVGTDLHYYAYIEQVTRRLNAPGAGRLVDDEAFGDIMENLDSCIAFMEKNPSYRDSESYLARYQSLLTKALHLLEVGLEHRLEKVSADISRQILATKSESARHALAYGRFEEMMLDSYSLIPNVQKVIHQAYDISGNALSGTNYEIYANTANNIFQSYIAARDRDLRPIIQHDLDTFKKEAKEASVETASRNFVKQSFERSYNEAMLFAKIFAVEPHYSTDPNSAFVTLKSHQRVMVNATNVVPIASNLQSALQTVELQTICNVLGWITNEYLVTDYEDEESAFTRHCQELAARLLAEHLWQFTDAAFEAEIAKSISRVTVLPDALKIEPVVDGVASSNAYPPVKRAVELLVMFDQSMPKERCQRNSPVVFKIVKETIQVLQRAEARIKASGPPKSGSTDPDLFILKNLLLLKNELVSLEIGDVRNDPGMQYFSQIWTTLTPQNLIGYVGSFIPSAAASFWGGGAAPAAQPQTPQLQQQAADDQDASEQLDDLLRQAIGAFTLRWATALHEGKAKKTGGKNVVKIENDLEDMLQRAFSNQPEVIGKLKEAIQMHQQAQSQKR